MSRVESHNTADPGRAHAGPARVVLRWRVGEEAARRVLGTDGRDTRVEVELTPADTGSWTATAAVLSGDEPVEMRRLGTTGATWVRDDSRGLLHIDADGAFRATFDLRGGETVVLYASTGILAQLGLLGGRYEVAGGDVLIANDGAAA